MVIEFDKLIKLDILEGIYHLQIPVIKQIARRISVDIIKNKEYFSYNDLTFTYIDEYYLIRDMEVRRNGTVYLNFTRNFNWDAGDFADRHSCYWDDRSAAKDMILLHDGFAVRFFKSDMLSNSNGKARCWGCFWKNGIIIWNGYGYPLSYISNILSRHFSQPVIPIRLCNKDTTDGMLYINDGHSYYVGPDDIKYNDHIDLDWEELGLEECNICTQLMYPWDNYGEGVCESCLYDHLFFCDWCSSYCNKEEEVLRSYYSRICFDCVVDKLARKVSFYDDATFKFKNIDVKLSELEYVDGEIRLKRCHEKTKES